MHSSLDDPRVRRMLDEMHATADRNDPPLLAQAQGLRGADRAALLGDAFIPVSADAGRLLYVAMRGRRRSVLARLQKKHVLAKLDRLEREHFLQKHLGWAPHDTPASEAVWRAAVVDLPNEMDDAQLEAWLELAEIASDERFQRTLQRQFEWGRALGPNGNEGNQGFQLLLGEAVRVIRTRKTLDDATSRKLLESGFTPSHGSTAADPMPNHEMDARAIGILS